MGMDEKARFGFLLYLLERLGENRYYGMIVVQKIVYFLREAFGADLPYRFHFYHFGPYSDALDWDLQMMRSFGLIRIGSDPKKTGYSIQVNEQTSDEAIRAAHTLIERNKDKIRKVLGLFGQYPPSRLELASTIHFVHNTTVRGKGKAQHRSIVGKEVKELKPKFGMGIIEQEYDCLAKTGILR